VKMPYKDPEKQRAYNQEYSKRPEVKELIVRRIV